MEEGEEGKREIHSSVSTLDVVRRCRLEFQAKEKLGDSLHRRSSTSMLCSTRWMMTIFGYW